MTTFVDETLPGEKDTVPELESVEYPCQVCGREAGPYAGKGRKPKLCDEHKKSPAGTKRIGNSSGRNSTLASQAADVLITTHRLGAFGARMVGYENTADAIMSVNDEFRTQAYEALLVDPELCRAILRGGPMPGRVALIMAYMNFAAIVAPTAMVEYKLKREERREALMSDDG